MIDMMIIVPTDKQADWYMDIDIIKGKAVDVPGDLTNTKIHRAAVASVLARGSIPGREDIGADWAGLAAGKTSFVEVDNQVKANMEEYAGASTLDSSPFPVYEKTEDGLRVSLVTLTKPTINGAKV